MVNLETLKSKIESLVPTNKEKFKEELKQIHSQLVKIEPPLNKPLLVHTAINKNAIFYMLITYYSLVAKKILDFTITTGQNFITQHFMDNADKDKEFNSKLYYTDLLFITVSQLDYTSEYLESLIIDLIETRTLNNKTTIIVYDSVGATSKLQKLSAYFDSIEAYTLNTSPSKLKPTGTAKPLKKERFL